MIFLYFLRSLPDLNFCDSEIFLNDYIHQFLPLNMTVINIPYQWKLPLKTCGKENMCRWASGSWTYWLPLWLNCAACGVGSWLPGSPPLYELKFWRIGMISVPRFQQPVSRQDTYISVVTFRCDDALSFTVWPQVTLRLELKGRRMEPW